MGVSKRSSARSPDRRIRHSRSVCLVGSVEVGGGLTAVAHRALVLVHLLVHLLILVNLLIRVHMLLLVHTSLLVHMLILVHM